MRAAACVTRARSRQSSTAATASRARSRSITPSCCCCSTTSASIRRSSTSRSASRSRRRSSRTCSAIRRGTPILHVDLQRVLDDEKIRITMPIHFKGEAGSPGVKTRAAWSRTCARRRSHLPAEGPAGVHRGRPVGRRPQRDAVPLRPQAAGGRRDRRADARPRCAGRLDPRAARRRAGSGGEAPRRPRARLRRLPARARQAAKPAAGSRRAAKPRRSQEGRRQEVTRTLRPQCSGRKSGLPCTGAARLFACCRRQSDSSWPAHRCSSSSGSAIRARAPAHAPQRRLLVRRRAGAAARRAVSCRTHATRASSPGASSRATELGC